MIELSPPKISAMQRIETKRQKKLEMLNITIKRLESQDCDKQVISNIARKRCHLIKNIGISVSCVKCGCKEAEKMTRHHVIPDSVLKALRSIDKSNYAYTLLQQRGYNTTIYLCRSCHDKIEKRYNVFRHLCPKIYGTTSRYIEVQEEVVKNDDLNWFLNNFIDVVDDFLNRTKNTPKTEEEYIKAGYNKSLNLLDY